MLETTNVKTGKDYGASVITSPIPSQVPEDSPAKNDHYLSDTDVNSYKKYHCRVCNKGFTRKHNMVSHELIHSTVRPHDCPKCDLKFRRIHDLRRHEKLHTGEKPYACPRCSRSFSRPDALARHQNSPVACNWDATKPSEISATVTQATQNSPSASKHDNDATDYGFHIQSVFPLTPGSCHINIVEKFSPKQSEDSSNEENDEEESEKVQQQKRNRSKISISAITNNDVPIEKEDHGTDQRSELNSQKKDTTPDTFEVREDVNRMRLPNVKIERMEGPSTLPNNYNNSKRQGSLDDSIQEKGVSEAEFQMLVAYTSRLEESIWSLNERIERLEKESDIHNKKARSSLLNYLDQKRGRELREAEECLDQERGRLDRQLNTEKRMRTK